LDALTSIYPQWRLAADERDEFSHWMSSSGDPDFRAEETVERAPRKATELVTWLRKPPPARSAFHEDTWRETCRKHLLNSLCALRALALDGEWPEQRWREALQAWGEKPLAKRSWRYAALVVAEIPASSMETLAHQLAWWLKSVSEATDCRGELFLQICRSVLSLNLDAGTGIQQNGRPIDQPVTEAINHPVGIVTQALLNLWFKSEPNDNAGLPADLKSIFTDLCDVHTNRYRHGRVILYAHLISLFRVDRSWTEGHVLPGFDWQKDALEARSAWEGFLWSPRLYMPLLAAFKQSLLTTARHYAELGEHGRQYAAFITYAALELLDGFEPSDFQAAFSELPNAGLQEAAQAFSQAMAGAGDQREHYWRNRAFPFWLTVWPKSRNLISPAIAEQLAEVAIAAGAEFPHALVHCVIEMAPGEFAEMDRHISI